MEICYSCIGNTLCDWFEVNQRDLPWRHTRNPYAIWVSEIMLQQTRVEAVINRYDAFLHRFPDIAALAASSREEVRFAWRGLGYYRRAENLRLGAVYVAERFGGVFPGTLEEIRTIPGIGVYTAGAIASFAFDIPVPAVDGNVLRVISRLCCITDCVDDPAVRRTITEIAGRMLPESRVWALNQGLMELGAVVCLPGRPRCAVCPLAEYCRGRAAGSPESLPRKQRKKEPAVETRQVYLVRCDEWVLLHRRPEKGLLAGLWEFPGADTPGFDSFPMEKEEGSHVLHARHGFTHIIWEMDGVEVTIPARFPLPDDSWMWVSLSTLQDWAIPSAMNAFLRYLLPEN